MIQGLIFVRASRDLDLPAAPLMFCGDPSKEGYSLSVARTDACESFELSRYFERWRFKRVEPAHEEAQRLIAEYEPSVPSQQIDKVRQWAADKERELAP